MLRHTKQAINSGTPKNLSVQTQQESYPFHLKHTKQAINSDTPRNLSVHTHQASYPFHLRHTKKTINLDRKTSDHLGHTKQDIHFI